MKHWRQIASKDNPHMHFWDILERTPLKLTVSRVGSKQVDSFNSGPDEQDVKETMLFLYFDNEKPLGMNITNLLIMESFYGPDHTKWPGKQITLRHAMCRKKDCIRLQVKKGYKFTQQNIPKFKYLDQSPKSQSAPTPPTPTPTPTPTTTSLPDTSKTAKPITQKQVLALDKMIVDIGEDLDYSAFLSYFKIDALMELPADEYQTAVDMLGRKTNRGKHQ